MSVRNLEALFRPSRIAVLGQSRDAAGDQCLLNLEKSLPGDRRYLIGAKRKGWKTFAVDSQWPSFDMALVLDGYFDPASTLARLSAAGCRALNLIAPPAFAAESLAAWRGSGLRLLGGATLGSCCPVIGFNATSLQLDVNRGTTALIAQSRSIAAAAIDWAVGRSIGLSWMACSGTELDVDVADLLDHAALDPQTRGVVLQLSRIGDARKFMSAARACARLKPVVVLQTPAAYDAPLDKAFSAAFRRAGLVECESLSALFDALQALERLPRLQSDRIALCANDGDAMAVGAGALRAARLTPVVAAPPSGSTTQTTGRDAPAASGTEPTLTMLAEALRTGDVAAALYVHAPAAEPDSAALARAIGKAGFGERLCVAWLGLATARPVWQLLADAQVAVYPSVTAAARALSYCRHYQVTKELLTQTPTIAQIEVESRSVRTLLAAHISADRLALRGEEVDRILSHYGVAAAPAASEMTMMLHVHCRLHRELGMVMELRPEAGEMRAATAVALPPLDDCLARSALEEAGLDGADQPQLSGLRHRAAPLLIRIAELLVDQEAIDEIDLRLRIDGGTLSVVPGALIRLSATPLPPRRRLALAPYPIHLEHRFGDAGDTEFRCRAVLPTDEAALLALLSKIPAEDIRLRFFTYIREFTHAMAARMTQIDYDRELSIIAMPVNQADEVIAIATLIADTDGSAAEFAILVHQDYRFKGVARHLMECLLERARAKGIGKVFGEVLRENDGMRQLARSLGFVEQLGDPQTVHVEWSQPSSG